MQAPVEQSTPQSRPSISERDNTPKEGPVPLFDHHIRILSDSYLSFFQERKKIEETYVDSLIKLHRKTKAIDAYFDDRSELITTRTAWAEVRDNIEREAQTRQAFLSTLTIDAVNSLTALKDTQDRTRKRIKEDLKESSNAYNEYAEGVLPKLKRTYLRKCQDVEDHKAAAAQPHIPQTPRAEAAPQFPAEHHGSPLTNTKSNPSVSTKPVVTSPQPLRPLDRRPSGSMPTARNRSPSTTTAFSDLASHGKKQLNQLITFLDKGGSVKESLGGRSENSALRAVRSKREAEEADKEYRKGVHWLETLRLRKTKTLEAGYASLERFIHESATTMQRVLEKYTDNMIATTTTQTQLSSHVRQAVDRISPTKDTQILTQTIPRSLASAIPKPVLYWNYSVGESSDLIFGVSLVDYATARGLVEGETPKIIRICTSEIDARGLESEGIYSVSGRHAVVLELQHKIERNEAEFEFNPITDDVFAVSSLLKMYLRELPEPVFKYPLQDRLQHTEDKAEHQANNFVLLRAKMRRLPPVHQATLKAVVEHLARVAALSEKNKMDVKNLAIVFGGVIFGEDDLPKGGDLLSMQSWKDTLMEDLITHAAILFDDRAPAVGSPPLPPAPAGQSAPNYAYGSAHTRVANMPAPLQTPVRQHQQSQSQSQSPEDFTPRLPSRPANSIHPSARMNPTSPTKTNMDAPPPLPARPGRISPTKAATLERTSPAKSSVSGGISPTKGNTSDKPSPHKSSTSRNASPTKHSAFEKTAPAKAPSPDKALPSPTDSMPAVTQEEVGPVVASKDQDGSAASAEPTYESSPPSPTPTSKSPRTPKSLAPSLPISIISEAVSEGVDGPGFERASPSSPGASGVPGGYPS